MKVHLDTKAGTFICDFDGQLESSQAIKAGFHFNPITCRLESLRMSSAAALRSFADDTVKEILTRISCDILEPWRGGISIPDDKSLSKYQRLGVKHILERNHSYVAFEQGLGKTPTAIVAMNSFGKPTLILVPPHLISNWKREIDLWKTKDYRVEVMSGVGFETGHGFADIILCPDSIIGRPEIIESLRMACKDFGFLIVDEAQHFVNDVAERTKALFGEPYAVNGICHWFEKVSLLSGTPMPNRPMELFPALSALAANTISYRDKPSFGIKYCGGFEGQFGWNFKGESNGEELRSKMHNVFMRREEKSEHIDVEKFENVVHFTNNQTTGVNRLEKEIIGDKKLSSFLDLVKSGGFQDDKKNLGRIADYRSAVAQLKISYAANFISKILCDTNESVLVLGWHQDAIAKLARKLDNFHPVVIQGKTPASKRDSRIEAFQMRRTRLLVANIKTMVGCNITKATRVVFFEYSWTPADNSQAMDRAHRIGQTKNVLVEYLVLDESLDSYVLQTILKKQIAINKIVNKPTKGKS